MKQIFLRLLKMAIMPLIVTNPSFRGIKVGHLGRLSTDLRYYIVST
jgi:Na+/H+-dicarboxylate symporter